MNIKILKHFGLPLLLGLFSLSLSAQICNKGPVIHFEFSGSKLSPAEEQRLDSMIVQAEEAGSAYIELVGHTDTKGPAVFNMYLGGLRNKAVEKYIEKNTDVKDLTIRDFNFGETRPLVNDTTDELRAINRRVEVYFFPLKDGKVVLAEKNGTSISMNKADISSCGICGTATTAEVRNTGSFSAQNDSLIAEDGQKLETIAMIKMIRECEDKDAPCTKATLTIPAEKDDELSVWEPLSNDKNTKWKANSKSLNYDSKAKAYVMDVDLCNQVWLSLSKPARNMDIIDVKVPLLSRTRLMQPYLIADEEVEAVWQDDVNAVSTEEEIEQEEEMEEDEEYQTEIDGQAYIINPLTLSSYTDSTFMTECEDCKDLVMLHDTGYADNGFTYYYNGPLSPAYTGSVKKLHHYKLTLESYTPVIKFTDSVAVIKLPKKFANLVRIEIMGADTALRLRRYNKKDNQFKIRIPAHDYQVTFRESVKDRYMYPGEALCFNYVKKRKLYFAKIRKKDVMRRED